MNKTLTFHYHGTSGNEASLSPAYSLLSDIDPLAVSIYAVKSPIRDARIDIYADGVSIFQNRTSEDFNETTGANQTGAADTTVVLTAGENSSDFTGNLSGENIVSGTWITCKLIDAGGGADFTVNLEVSVIAEED